MLRSWLLLIIYIIGMLLAKGEESVKIDSIGQFNRIRLYGNVNIQCHIIDDSSSDKQYIGTVLHCQTGNYDSVVIRNNHGTLTIYVNEDSINSNAPIPAVQLYTDSLNYVENSYDGQLRISGIVQTDIFTAKQQSNGSIIVENLDCRLAKLSLTAGHGSIVIDAGNCDKLHCGLVGAGHITTIGLIAADVKCRFLGGGSISCNSSASLSVFGVGTTKIKYSGKPKISRFLNKCHPIEIE